MRYYTIIVGCHEMSGWYPSDTQAKKVAYRWIRMFFHHLYMSLKERHAYSIAFDALKNDPECRVYRHHVGKNDTISFSAACIEKYSLTPYCKD